MEETNSLPDSNTEITTPETLEDAYALHKSKAEEKTTHDLLARYFAVLDTLEERSISPETWPGTRPGKGRGLDG